MTRALPALPVGSRVVIRYRLAVPDPLTGAALTDVVGTLRAADGEALVVTTPAGEVRVRAGEVVTAKVVPPRPSRRGAAHLALSVDDLQRVMVGAWGALERESLGDWRLRASLGFTARGNSVATPGSPGIPLEAAVDRCRDWYAARGLPLDVTLAGPVGFAVADDPLGALLIARGAEVATRSLTMTASARTAALATIDQSVRPVHGPLATIDQSVRPVHGSTPAVRLREEPTDAWLTAYQQYRTGPAEAVRAVLTGSERQWFAETAEGEGAEAPFVGIGRLAVNDGWGGIAAMWVDPSRRRSGLARAMLAAMAGRAVETGAASLHLQVLTSNEAARDLYTTAGFVPHHEYVNLVLR